jgi:predicted methyltransferase
VNSEKLRETMRAKMEKGKIKLTNLGKEVAEKIPKTLL